MLDCVWCLLIVVLCISFGCRFYAWAFAVICWMLVLLNYTVVFGFPVLVCGLVVELSFIAGVVTCAVICCLLIWDVCDLVCCLACVFCNFAWQVALILFVGYFELLI